MTFIKQARKKRERGVAMIMAMLALLLLSIIGLAFLSMSLTENSGNSNYKDSQKAYFASRAGLENVRALLWSNANFQTQVTALNMPTFPVVAPAVNSGVIYALDPTGAEVVDPTAGRYVDDELCHEQYLGLGLAAGTIGAPCGLGAGELMPAAPPPPALPYYLPANLNAGDILNSGTPSALSFKWVRITNKQNFMPLSGLMVDGSNPNAATATAAIKKEQVCYTFLGQEVATPSCAAWNANIANSFNQATPVWLLTSLALTPTGSRRMTQMEVAFTPPISVNATIATSGTIKLTGKVTVDGTDDCTADKSHLSIYTGECVPGANGCSNAITNNVPPDKLIGANGNTGVTTYNSSGQVQTQGSTGQGSWPYPVDQIINQYKQMATPATASPYNYNPNCNGGGCSLQTEQMGTFPTNPLTGQPESTSPQAADGTPAIVYVPGNLELKSPKAGGDGLLIVDGDLTVDGGLEYYGLILVKGQIHFTGGGSQGVNLFGAILAGDSASASDAVGGSFSFKYSSCALKQTSPPGPPKLLATHEIMY